MVREASAHAEEDRRRRELVDARNQADSLAYSVEKTINENRDRLPAVEVERVERAIADVREAVKGDNLEAIRTASGELQKASHAIAEQLYKQQGQAPGQSRGGPQSGGHDEVVDGEVVEA
jgi:molecular chaperone DnaK